MPWESDEDGAKPGRDWTRIMWVAVAVVVVAGVAVMFVPRDRNPSLTEARVRHILIRPDAQTEEAVRAALEEITQLRERILNGDNFSRLASEFSDDSLSAPRGGDLGWVGRAELAAEIDEYIWTAPLGEVSPTILTGHGFHLVVVTDRHFSSAEQYDRELKDRVLQGDPSAKPDGK
jgi:parvulin-like peptidyl-prolyl isomerase